MSIATRLPRRRGFIAASGFVAALVVAIALLLIAVVEQHQFAAIGGFFDSDSFANDLVVGSAESVARLLAGLAIGTIGGVIVGAAMGTSAFVDRLLGSVVDPLRQIPLFGWVPLLGLWAGLGEGSKVSFVALAVSYVMVIAAHDGVRAAPPALREVCDAVALGPMDRLRFLIVPAALPAIFSGLRVAIAVAWSAEIGAEILMASAPGLGSVIWGAREVGRLDLLLAGTSVIGALGVISSLLVRFLESKAIRWHQR
jgi:sulfonate transport system permease protein